MPAKKPAVVPLKMTLRSRGTSQDIQTKESKLEVTEEKPKRKVRRNLKQEAVEEELNNNVVKEQSEETVFKENLKPAAAGRVERQKRKGKEAHRDAKVAKVVDAVTEEKKKSVRQRKNKSCEAPEESQTVVQRAALGNEESDKVEAGIENKKKRKAVTGRRQGRQLRSDAVSAESQSDEQLETFSTDDWRAIEGIKARAERMFDVKLVAWQEKHSTAANVAISGSNRETRLLCKEYLFALTRPGCTTVFPYPPEKHSFLTEDAVHEKLERDSQAYLVFRRIGEVEIYGLDSLSVALAMSSLECLLENQRTTESDEPSVSASAIPEKEDSMKHQKTSRRSSILLDVELKNWMSNSEDDAYRNTSEAVRHSILSVVKDESREVRMEAVKVKGTPVNGASPAHNSGALKLLSDAYMSFLDDSVAPFSPSATDGNPTASLGMESVKKNILEDPDFASCSSQHKEKILAEAETTKTENSAIETETKQSEITNSFTADEARLDRKKLATEAEGKQTDSANEDIITRDSKTKMSIIIVSSDSESEAQKEKRDRSKTTSIKSNCTDSRKEHRHNDSGRSFEIRVPSGNQKSRQVHSSEPGMNLPDSESRAQKDQRDRSKTTSASDRKVYLNDSGLCCEIRVPSGNQKPRPVHRSEPTINLRSVELHGTQTSRGHANRTLDNQTGSSATKTIQVDAVSSTKLPVVRSDSLKKVQLTQNPTAASSNPVAPPAIYPLLSIAVVPPTSSLASTSKLRYVVIDGSNVAMAHGKNQAFSCPGLELCIKYFLERGHRENQITAFVPQSRLSRPHHSQKPIVGQHLLQKLADRGLVVFTPARKVPGRHIVCYDDRYVLRLAAHTNGIVVTNDNYRDLWLERNEWREIIENRLLPFSFVNDLFMPPDDPLGRNGPNLNQFLSDHHQPHYGQRNQNANPKTGCISQNAKLVSVRQWYQKR